MRKMWKNDNGRMRGTDKNSKASRRNCKATKESDDEVMEAEVCLKVFINSAKQFFNKRNESSLRNVRKNLENLLQVKFTLQTFDPRNLIVSDCVVNLIELLNDPNSGSAVQVDVIGFFYNLTVQHPLLISILQSTFDLSLSLSTYLSLKLDDPKQVGFIECLHLLAIITDQHEFPEDVTEELFQFVTNKIDCSDSTENEFLLPCLQLLKNLCCRSQRIHHRVKTMENAKSFYKTLMKLISNHGDQRITVASLSLFTTLNLNEPIWNNLFNPRNIQQSIELLFNILCKNDQDETNFCAAVNLFLDLLKNERIQNHLAKYKHLDICLTHLLEIVSPNVSTASMIKILQLLNGFCSIDFLKAPRINLILRCEIETKKFSPISAAIETLSTSPERIQFSLTALNFLITLFKVIVHPAPPADLTSQIDCFLVKIVDIFREDFNPDDLTAKWRCQQISAIINSLSILLAEPLYRDKILNSLDRETCEKLLESHLNAKSSPAPQKAILVSDCNNESVDVVLEMCRFLSQVDDSAPELKNLMVSILKDFRLIPFIASALSSDSTVRTDLGLKLVMKGSAMNNFQFKTLTEMIASNNKNDLLQRTVQVPVNVKSNGYHLAANMDELIEKMENGLKVTDIKQSEIMEMYEHKIESFKMKENHLHDLLEAKTNALQEVERILNHYRCRWAQSDAEALNLRSLLHESEKRSEVAREQTTTALIKQQELKDECEGLVKDIKKMERTAEEKNDACNELLDRLEKAEKTCRDLRQENEHKIEINSLLQRHIEDHKEKEKVMSEKLAELEQEKKNLNKQVKDKETSILELAASLDKSERSLNDKSRFLTEREKEISQLKNKMENLGSEKQSLQDEVSALEENCGQLEKNLKEMETKLRTNIDELERQRQITSIIQSITSGKVDLSLLDNNK